MQKNWWSAEFLVLTTYDRPAGSIAKGARLTRMGDDPPSPRFYHRRQFPGRDDPGQCFCYFDGASAVRWVDLSGFGAAILVFMTFYMKGMIQLRILALCSNVAFLLYACPMHLFPIIALHGALIPINLCRLVGACNGKPFGKSVGSQGSNRAIGQIIDSMIKYAKGTAGRWAHAFCSLYRQISDRLQSALYLLRQPSLLHNGDKPTALDMKQRETSVAWTLYSRALLCAIGALVLIVGILLVIETAPASRSEISFSGPVG